MDGESILQELLLFLQVNGLETGSDRSTRSTAGVQDVATVVVLSSVQQGLNTGLGVRPGAGVKRLLLGPDDVLGIGVAVKVLLELAPGEGVELLNTGDGGVANAVGLTVLDKSGVDLTRAEDDTLNLLGLIDGHAVGGVRDNALEVRVLSECLQVGTSNGVTQQCLGEEDNQG